MGFSLEYTLFLRTQEFGISSKVCIRWHHVGSLKLVMVKVFRPHQKSTYAASQGIFESTREDREELPAKHTSAHPWMKPNRDSQKRSTHLRRLVTWQMGMSNQERRDGHFIKQCWENQVSVQEKNETDTSFHTNPPANFRWIKCLSRKDKIIRL